jgi:hypothetical protein
LGHPPEAQKTMKESGRTPTGVRRPCRFPAGQVRSPCPSPLWGPDVHFGGGPPGSPKSGEQNLWGGHCFVKWPPPVFTRPRRRKRKKVGQPRGSPMDCAERTGVAIAKRIEANLANVVREIGPSKACPILGTVLWRNFGWNCRRPEYVSVNQRKNRRPLAICRPVPATPRPAASGDWTARNTPSQCRQTAGVWQTHEEK